MKRILCIAMCFLIVLLIAGCTDKGEGRSEYSLLGEYKKSDSVPEYDFMSDDALMPEGFDRYVSGITDFSFGLLSQVSDDEENALVSPLSVFNVLAMLSAGADNQTQKELRHTLTGTDVSVINEGTYYLNSRLNAFNCEDGSFKTADSLWLDDSFDVKTAFLQTAVDYYNAEVMRLDFGDASASSEINKWIKSNTDGEITDMIKSMDEDALMVLVNAVLMQDEWATVYNEEQLSTGVFHGTKGESDVEFMSSQERYISSYYAQGFVKGFKNLPLKFVALIPEQDISVCTFAQNLTSARWQELMESQEATSFCQASLPEFNLDFDISLTDTLKNMGINKAFDMEMADFSQLSNTGKPYISEVKHSAFIEIGPKGAKAGATTAAVMSDGASFSEVPEVTLNRPFVFVICDNESNIPVFAGIVNNISE